MHTGDDFFTDKQRARLDALFGDDAHTALNTTWSIYQRMIAAYREPDRTIAKWAMTKLIAALGTGVPAGLVELRRLGRTLKRRA